MLTIGGIVSRAANAAVSTFSVGVSIQVRKSKGQIAYEAMAAKNTIPLQRSPLFNPALDYTQFLLSAVMPAWGALTRAGSLKNCCPRTSISGGIVAENNMVWRRFGRAVAIRFMAG